MKVVNKRLLEVDEHHSEGDNRAALTKLTIQQSKRPLEVEERP
jgi:hypothetical protein